MQVGSSTEEVANLRPTPPWILIVITILRSLLQTGCNRFREHKKPESNLATFYLVGYSRRGRVLLKLASL